MVDLEKKFHVSSIKIYNRKDKGYLHCIYNCIRETVHVIYSEGLIRDIMWFYILN